MATGPESKREEFYKLLREYVIAVRERDLAEQQFRASKKEMPGDEARRNLERLTKSCKELRRKISRYPDVNAVDPSRNRLPLRYKVQGK